MVTDEHGSFLIEALSLLIRVYPWLDLSLFGVFGAFAVRARTELTGFIAIAMLKRD